MNDQARVTRKRRAFLAGVTVATGIAAIGTSGWLAASPGTRKDLYAWYGRAAESHSAALPAGFEDLVDRIKPAVVGVRAKVEQDDEEESPHPGRGASPGGRASPQRHIATSQGSGFFISSDGLALTTYHVVARNKKIEVVADDGKTYAAKLVAADPKTDLALLKVEGGGEFPVARMADRAPRIGEWVLAIGNPFGLGGTVTAGIVSAGARGILSPYSDCIQIDAPINQGNSGGPTFDTTGKVIGVNSAIFSPSGGSVGVGFAIPAETVKVIADKLKAKGAVSRGWIGIEVQSMTPEIAEGIGLDKPVEGVVVTEVQPDSPATKAGMEPGDVVTSFAGQAASDERHLIRRAGEMSPGQQVELHLIHRNQERSITVALGELPVERTESRPDGENPEPARGGDKSRMGMMLMAADTLGLGDHGVAVAGLTSSGVAAEIGLSVGDVILEVGGTGIKAPDDFFKALDGVQTQGKRIALARIKSKDATRFVAIPVK